MASVRPGPFQDFYQAALAKGIRPTMAQAFNLFNHANYYVQNGNGITPIATSRHPNPLHDRIAVGLKLSHSVPVDVIDLGALGRRWQQVTMKSRLVWKQQRSA
jgi:hypothetical protein